MSGRNLKAAVAEIDDNADVRVAFVDFPSPSDPSPNQNPGDVGAVQGVTVDETTVNILLYRSPG